MFDVASFVLGAFIGIVSVGVGLVLAGGLEITRERTWTISEFRATTRDDQ